MSNSQTNITNDHAYRIAYLIAGYIKGTLTEKGHIELDEWINSSDWNMQIFEKLTDEKYLSQVQKNVPPAPDCN